MAGSAIASALNIVDGLVVIGGGLAGASHYILPALVNELRATLSMFQESNSHVCRWKFITGKMKWTERSFWIINIVRS